jgi:plasmid stabilization system protein ParE
VSTAARYELTPAARLDLLEAPNLGHRRPDLTSRNVLFYRVHSYLIIYRPNKKPLHILRVLHGARDVETLLKE